ncbi:hypothetical protein COLO4_12254 [Corchorus olitorius]|uniref:Uncharacterized protein n=1 Tax=Corchorus olitorius TaxID=93759 RepID=A0A1R3K1I6_9ROSI|nr:hypothetical protein COLO4_12254 [Corchorus olitorius]
MERMEAKYHEKAVETGSLVVSACGFDSIPAEMGVMFNTRQWVAPAVPNRVDAYVSLESDKRIVGNFATYESAVLGVANMDKLQELRRSRPKRPRPVFLTGLSPDPVGRRVHYILVPKIPGPAPPKGPVIEHQEQIGLKAVKLPSADAVVVRRTLVTLMENPHGLPGANESAEHAEKREAFWSSVKPAHFGVKIGSKSLLGIYRIIGVGLFLGLLGQTSFGRWLLLKFPSFFSFGWFRKNGPSEDEVRSASFKMWFVGYGYSDSSLASQNSKPDMQIITRVMGPEIGYVTTPIALIQCALILLSQRENLPKGGVFTPGIVFGPDLQERLQENGISFDLISKEQKFITSLLAEEEQDRLKHELILRDIRRLGMSDMEVAENRFKVDPPTPKEDLERLHCYQKIHAECNSCYNKLLPPKYGRDPFKLVAEGKINLDGFPLLREQDIGRVFKGYLSDMKRTLPLCHMPWVTDFGLTICEQSDSFKKKCLEFEKTARDVLLEFEPPDEESKMKTSLEFRPFPSCAPALNEVKLKAVNKLDMPELEKLSIYSTELKDDLVRMMECSMEVMVKERLYDLRCVHNAVTVALEYGPFGSFSDDVFELVRIADSCRRVRGHRYISKHHFRSAFKLTKIEDCCIKELVKCVRLRLFDKPATCPPYRLYMSARAIADIHGAKDVELEHMVVATIYGLERGRQKKRVDLNDFTKKKCVKKFFADVECYKKKYGKRLLP